MEDAVKNTMLGPKTGNLAGKQADGAWLSLFSCRSANGAS
jgi:hypothetical protein